MRARADFFSSVRILILLFLIPTLLALQASLCCGACVELDSDTEAVVNQSFKLVCISCKKRGEVQATASVSWYFRAANDKEYSRFYIYKDATEKTVDARFYGRLGWNGSNNTKDLQDGSIYINNVTFEDAGTYQCTFNRILMYQVYQFKNSTSKSFVLTVVPQKKRSLASILSEVMMYVSIIGLQLWLVVEMIYCYRKISAVGEEALRESPEEYLAIASETKDNCVDVQGAL